MEKPKNKNLSNTASRISAIASSVMDLHVRIALQEMDREKRRFNQWWSISGNWEHGTIISTNLRPYYFLSFSKKL